MYSLLIVDDEPKITDYLFYVFSDLEEVELEVSRAYSAVEAMGLMKKNKVDIVMTDINMPVMNGLEFHKNIREIWPACKVIFLTGYSEFEYVHAALRNASVDYVLKTEGEERIIEAVTKAVDELESELRNRQLVENAWKDRKEAILLLRERYLVDLLDGARNNEAEMFTCFSGYNIELDPELPVLLVSGRVDSWKGASGLHEKTGILYGIRNIAAERLQPSTRFTSVIYERIRLVWFIQPPREDMIIQPGNAAAVEWEKTAALARAFTNTVQGICRESLDISISFAVCKQPVSWTDISKTFNRMKYEISKASVLGNELLLVIDDSSAVSAEREDEADNQPVRLQFKKLEVLEDMLENGQKEKFLEVFSDIVSGIDAAGQVAFELRREIYYRIATMFMSHLNRWGLNGKVRQHMDPDLLCNMERHESWKAASEYFEQLADCIYMLKNNDGFVNANRIFGFIKSYTEQNLGGDLSLSKFADMLHFHPFYLSRLFKQVTGKKISEYIAGVKLSKAREILKANDMKINEIAGVLGFEAPSYFTRFFKKSTGMTPQEYRDSLRIS